MINWCFLSFFEKVMAQLIVPIVPIVPRGLAQLTLVRYIGTKSNEYKKSIVPANQFNCANCAMRIYNIRWNGTIDLGVA